MNSIKVKLFLHRVLCLGLVFRFPDVGLRVKQRKIQTLSYVRWSTILRYSLEKIMLRFMAGFLFIVWSSLFLLPGISTLFPNLPRTIPIPSLCQLR